MNVKELLEELQKYDMETEVMVFSKFEESFVDIHRVDLWEHIFESKQTVGIIGDDS